MNTKESNLKIYEEWILSGGQSDVFFGDLVDECYRIHLVSGDTFYLSIMLVMTATCSVIKVNRTFSDDCSTKSAGYAPTQLQILLNSQYG